jgi:hypothetical protein
LQVGHLHPNQCRQQQGPVEHDFSAQYLELIKIPAENNDYSYATGEAGHTVMVRIEQFSGEQEQRKQGKKEAEEVDRPGMLIF